MRDNNGFIKDLHPLTKITALLLSVVSLFILKSSLSLSIFSFFLFITVLLSGIRFKVFLKRFKFFVFFTLFICLLIGFTSGFETALITAFRLFITLGLSSVFMNTTRPEEIACGFETVFGTKVRGFALSISITMTFLNVLKLEAEKIKDAQLARGAKIQGKLIGKARSFVPFVVPLFASSLRRASELSQSMESRCYSADRKKTFLNTLGFKEADFLAFLIFIPVFLFAIYMRLEQW